VEPKRKITRQQEKIYRLVSSDFEGLTVAEAAILEGVTPRAIQRVLQRLEQIAPQLFPILTRQEAQVLKYIEVDHLTNQQIAEHLKVTCSRVSQITKSLVDKGKLNQINPGRALSYHPGMDAHIVEKF
jgi:DNA-directed RNA polymerase specialized sigma subunit